ncbi:hypothetical protein CROQUDRAFT_69036 [Cronartium quercuum f. sp. fusiforme G11]|uniref:MTHFR SAM-binding regulatory domain-containing protein n=1 Tax=Cronartium quercuum f. sp. fusiforme G11 TaxID=708437 RepID=A0A9P6N6R4_9BASI|nr:hypothetical protein CROQUDRAFT_69036 [Cronartium quercuum f. sp. fusiforme G11]
MKKVTDLINSLHQSNQVYYTLEFFPPKTNEGIHNLQTRIERMLKLNPSIIHITWSSNNNLLQTKTSMDLSNFIQNDLNLPTCLHLTCTNTSIDSIKTTLNKAKDLGIVNILALRGDPPRDKEYNSHSEFEFAIDLIKFIKLNYNDTFCLGVAGYPELGMNDHKQFKQELCYLKSKVDAGAEFIVTQIFYDADQFLNWYKSCREIGIKVPIIPGIMPIQSYDSFRRLTSLCKITVPEYINETITPIKSHDEAVKAYGLELSTKLIKTLLDHDIKCFHLCTLNLEQSITKLIQSLKWITTTTESSLSLTNIVQAGLSTNWDEFPNGRFGDSRSPAFGTLDQYGRNKPNINQWGSPKTEKDINDLFISYTNHQINSIPWSEEPLLNETELIKSYLSKLNFNSFWTVSSQPAMDGIELNHQDLAFGSKNKGGIIYQKSFIEFFISKSKLIKLLKLIEIENKKIGINLFNYYAGNIKDEILTNVKDNETNSVTWCVFKNTEVITTTIIELTSFKSWKEEAFVIWKDWSNTFDKESVSRKLLDKLYNDRWLCTIIHHDYKELNALWDFLSKFLNESNDNDE